MGKAFIEELKRALGAPKVVTDPAIVSLYSREPTGLSSETLAVAFPDSASDVSKALSLAYKYEVPVYPQGSTTDLSGGALPEGGVVVSFERMNKVLNVSVLDSTADVEAGVRLGDLNVELSRYNYMFPVDPGSVLPCMWTYEDIAERHKWRLEGNKVDLYRKWASVYLSDGYKMLVKKLREVLDGSGRSVDGLSYYFEQALRYEILFWQASYVMEEWPF